MLESPSKAITVDTMIKPYRETDLRNGVTLPVQITPKLLLAGYLPSEMSAERIARGTPVASGGRARLPDGPGLGIDVDEAALGDPVLTVE